MTIPTTAVTVTVRSPTGVPIEGASFFAILSGPDTHQGTTAPAQAQAKTDAQGVATLNLMPNAIGLNHTTYTFSVQHKSFRPLTYPGVTVPETTQVALEGLVSLGDQTYLNGNALVLISE